jgi:hypothetical protein
VEFDEDWARGGAQPPAEDEGSGDGAAETPTAAEEAAAEAPQPAI